MIPLYLEVHADEVLLRQEPARWDQAAALLEALCRRAENEGARLSLRVRETLVEGDTSSFLRGLMGRGHEVGWHSHGRDPSELVRMFQERGLDVSVCTPGLVQAGERGREGTLRRARALGAKRITDSCDQRWFTYQGWLGWQPIPGLVSLDVSVSPFDWGVLDRRLGQVIHRHGGLDWNRLKAHLDTWSRWPVPEGYGGFFGATVHEHNFCAPDSLVPLASELDAFARYCAQVGSRMVPSGSIPIPDPPAEPELPPRRFPNPVRRLQIGLSRLLAPRRRFLTIGQRKLAYTVYGEPTRGALVVVHGGHSGLQQGLSFLGLPLHAFADEGIAVYLFERTESTFRTPGNPVHLADTRALLLEALATPVPVGLLSWSGGVVPAARLALEGRAAFLVDAEGPVDRFSLVPPTPGEWSDRPTTDDAVWADREAIRSLAQVQVPYLRLQGSHDHVHGRMTVHARRAVSAVPGGRLVLVPGLLRDHPETCKAEIISLFRPSN